MSAETAHAGISIVADASAVLAVLLNEDDADRFLSQLLLASEISMSPINWWEVQVRMRSLYGSGGDAAASRLIALVGVSIEPVSLQHAQAAFTAWTRYGGRPAKLNMGDCFAYALAKAKDIPLLYKGGDFAETDVKSM